MRNGTTLRDGRERLSAQRKPIVVFNSRTNAGKKTVAALKGSLQSGPVLAAHDDPGTAVGILGQDPTPRHHPRLADRRFCL